MGSRHKSTHPLTTPPSLPPTGEPILVPATSTARYFVLFDQIGSLLSLDPSWLLPAHSDTLSWLFKSLTPALFHLTTGPLDDIVLSHPNFLPAMQRTLAR